MNKTLTAEEAKNLTFPCLLEVWNINSSRGSIITVVMSLNNTSQFIALNGTTFNYAALPSPEIAEAMRKQFGVQSEYPKRMLVWDSEEKSAVARIVIGRLIGNPKYPYLAVEQRFEEDYKNGREYGHTVYKHAKPIPDPDPLSQEIAQLRQRLADLEAKHNQQA